MEQVHHTIGEYLFFLSRVTSLSSILSTFCSFLILLLDEISHSQKAAIKPANKRDDPGDKKGRCAYGLKSSEHFSSISVSWQRKFGYFS